MGAVRSKSRLRKCNWFKVRFDCETGCGYKIKYNPRYRYCPFCGKALIIINRSALEDEENED